MAERSSSIAGKFQGEIQLIPSSVSKSIICSMFRALIRSIFKKKKDQQMQLDVEI
jgi:hypothetical protein